MSKAIKKSKANNCDGLTCRSSFLEVLQAGGSVKLPSGYELQGDPEFGCIQLLSPAYAGVSAHQRDEGIVYLTEEGLNDAIYFAHKWQRDNADLEEA